MSDFKPTFHGEVMLAGWKESHNSGAIVSFWLPDSADLEVFKGLTAKKGNTAGQRFMAALVEIPDGELQRESESGTRGDGRGATTDTGGGGGAADPNAPSRSAPNELAKRLHVDGYFRNPKLWAAMEANGLYTQAEHKAYLESLLCWMKPSAMDAKQCQGDNIVHHCKSAATPAAGRDSDHPQKPPHWYGITLCSITHHQNWAHSGIGGATRKDKEWLLENAVAITADRMKLKMKAWLGISSLRDITQEQLKRFEEAIGL